MRRATAWLSAALRAAVSSCLNACTVPSHAPHLATAGGALPSPLVPRLPRPPRPPFPSRAASHPSPPPIRTEGDLDSAFVRYERCAGLAGANLAQVKLEGHGTPSGSIVLPQNSQPMEAGRYYVSIKGKPEICGDYRIHVDTLTQVR